MDTVRGLDVSARGVARARLVTLSGWWQVRAMLRYRPALFWLPTGAGVLCAVGLSWVSLGRWFSWLTLLIGLAFPVMIVTSLALILFRHAWGRDWVLVVDDEHHPEAMLVLRDLGEGVWEAANHVARPGTSGAGRRLRCDVHRRLADDLASGRVVLQGRPANATVAARYLDDAIDHGATLEFVPAEPGRRPLVRTVGPGATAQPTPVQAERDARVTAARHGVRLARVVWTFHGSSIGPGPDGPVLYLGLDDLGHPASIHWRIHHEIGHVLLGHLSADRPGRRWGLVPPAATVLAALAAGASVWPWGPGVAILAVDLAGFTAGIVALRLVALRQIRPGEVAADAWAAAHGAVLTDELVSRFQAHDPRGMRRLAAWIAPTHPAWTTRRALLGTSPEQG